jgi:hypothetical protein
MKRLLGFLIWWLLESLSGSWISVRRTHKCFFFTLLLKNMMCKAGWSDWDCVSVFFGQFICKLQEQSKFLSYFLTHWNLYIKLDNKGLATFWATFFTNSSDHPGEEWRRSPWMAAWHSGHRVRLQNRRSWVRIPPGCKVFRNLYTLQCCCHNLICNAIVWMYLRKINA